MATDIIARGMAAGVVSQVLADKQAVSEDRDAVEAAKTEVLNVAESIPEDYSTLSADVSELKEDIGNIYSKYFSIKDVFEDAEWLCGYSFSDNSPYVHTDERYFVSKNKIKVISGNTLKNPDTSKYLYALGFYNDNDSYISSDYTNAETYTFTADCNVRIAIKKQDNSAMTENEYPHNQSTSSNIDTL